MNMYLPAKYLEDGKVLYGASITIDMAYVRIPAGIDNFIQDDIIQNPQFDIVNVS